MSKKKHCPDLISMAECEMRWKKRQSVSCTACHLVHVGLQFRLMWNKEEGRGYRKSLANLVWQIDESSSLQSLSINKRARAAGASEVPDSASV